MVGWLDGSQAERRNYDMNLAICLATIQPSHHPNTCFSFSSSYTYCMATIRYTITQSSLGKMLIAATESGICAITLSDNPALLKRDLRKRFPKAELINGELQQEIKAITTYAERPTVTFDLPLDVRGTAFQQSVWKALRKIPVGKTASYGDIAKKIGKPKAVRAVAQACGANNIAVVIPCHRVVRTDGALSGYRWGVKRKAELLRRER